MREDLDGRSSKDAKNIDLSMRLDAKIADSTCSNRDRTTPGGNNTKVTLADVTSYNNATANSRETNRAALRNFLRHERLYWMMKDGAIFQDNSLWFYLDHFAKDRARHIDRLSTLVEESGQGLLVGPKRSTYENDGLNKYFEGYE
mmetsp:Transcript_54277/g.115292  ORF Transcript_54277/g.115292 Transcript_54277/m.115292 type:complete len:145 (+) Transcript_54277:67-501(+)